MTKEIISTDNALRQLVLIRRLSKKHCFSIWANWVGSKHDGINRWN